MTLENVYVIPHGDEIISRPNRESSIMHDRIIGLIKDDASDSIAIISPHSLRLKHHIPLINTEHLGGRYRIGNKLLKRTFESDSLLNQRIISSCKNVEEVNFVTSSGPLSVFPLDFGALIPLSFFRKRKISLLGQWRDGPRDDLVSFGRELYHSVEMMPYKITVIFSADQAHTHNAAGPYGYSSNASHYDKMVIDAISTGNFIDLKGINDEIIETAKPDSYWNMLSFYGFTDEAGRKTSFEYYYVQDYFGMLLAKGS